MIWPCVREAFWSFSVPHEGRIPWLYADSKGLVTIAVGCLVDPLPLALPLPLRRLDGSPASRDEIEADWRAVKGHPDAARLGAGLARSLTRLRLSDADLKALVMRRFDDHTEALALRFPDWPKWPAPAQLATHSLAWAAGVAFRFPKCEAALRAWDFATAAAECQIDERRTLGVSKRNADNRRLYLLAQRVVDEGLDPSLLEHPEPEPEAPVEGAAGAHALASWELSQSINAAIDRDRRS